MRVAIVLDNGFEELEAMGSIALLRRAGLDVDIVSLAGEKATGRFNVTYSPTRPFNTYDFSQADCLLIPGGPHHKTIRHNKALLEQIHYFAENKIIAAICAAPTILGQEGLLKGRRYTCFKDLDQDFGGEYVYAYAVTDGNLVTGISAAASIEFAWAVIEKLCGKEHTDKIKASVYYDAAH